MMMLNWTKILEVMDEANPQHEGPYKVGVYIRSGDTSNQVPFALFHQDAMEKMVRAISRLELDASYAEFGYSGRILQGRLQLKRLLEKAQNGNVDIILTNSINRLASNLKTMAEIAEVLKKAPHPIGLVFEKEAMMVMSTELTEWIENMARVGNYSRHVRMVAADRYPASSMPL